MNIESIKEIIKNNLRTENIFLNSEDNVHYKAIIVSNEFEGLTLINRQRKVNQVLKSFILEGQIHAISLKTYTVSEWDKIKFKSL